MFVATTLVGISHREEDREPVGFQLVAKSLIQLFQTEGRTQVDVPQDPVPPQPLNSSSSIRLTDAGSNVSASFWQAEDKDVC